jgi:1,4-dihydroxy-2-naphthoate octaprenyltransferase
MRAFLHKALHIYTLFRLVSLDIVFGVISGAYFASRIFDVSPSIYFWITLSTAVWIIYTTDHILDGIRTKKHNLGTYRFHFTNRIVLMLIGIVAGVTSSIFVFFFLEKELIIYGIYTFVLVSIYLLLNFAFRKRYRFFPKELIISALYTWGIFGGFVVLKGNIELFQILVIINYFLLVLVNVLVFSYFDCEEDRINKFNTLAVNFGKDLTKRLIFIILVTAFIFSLFIVLLYPKWIIFMIFVLMNFTLLQVIMFSSYFKSKGYYGIVADAIFFYPCLVFWFDCF